MSQYGIETSQRELSGIEMTLRAIHHAMQKQYLQYKAVDGQGLVSDFVDEYLHYSSAINGHVYIILPGRLIVFPDPIDIPDDQLWDNKPSAAGISRRFSARYYAELLGHLDARLAVNLGRGAAGAGTVFGAAGLGYEDGLLLPARDGCGGSACMVAMRVHDRLVTLGGGGGGGIALQCGGGAGTAPGFDGGAGVGTLVLSLLMELEGLGAGEAEAWLRLTCPRLLAALPEDGASFEG
jgi:hypothetical protein